VNLRDVAQRAGVSAATASRVFSGHTVVRPETRDKVLHAAEELGYVVNGLAKAMLGTAARPLAVVLPNMENTAFPQLLAGAEQTASEDGRGLVLSLTHGDAEREQAMVKAACEQRVAGLLLVDATDAGPDGDERIAAYVTALAAVDARMILCCHQYLPSQPHILTMNYDHISGIQQIVEDLAAKGHQRIAFMGWAATTTASQHFLGYSLGLRNAGLLIDSSLVVECPDGAVDAHLAALFLLNRPARPTAVVCLSDEIALGVYRAARAFDIDIPTQLAISGFGDAPCSADLTPSLTSVQVPYHDLGVRAAQLALGLVDVNARADLATKVILRESTG
jgi:LacI family transcriptional regulator